MLAHRRTRSTSSARRGRPTFILIARKPLREIVVGLAQELVERQIQVDAAGIAGHARIVAAEEAPQGQAGPLGLEIPQRDVHRRDREHRGPPRPP